MKSIISLIKFSASMKHEIEKAFNVRDMKTTEQVKMTLLPFISNCLLFLGGDGRPVRSGRRGREIGV